MDDLVNWGRKGSLWPLTFGLACCAQLQPSITTARPSQSVPSCIWSSRWRKARYQAMLHIILAQPACRKDRRCDAV